MNTAAANRIATADRFHNLSSMLHAEARRIAFFDSEFRANTEWQRLGREGQRCNEVARKINPSGVNQFGMKVY